jgi:hypothetical protein
MFVAISFISTFRYCFFSLFLICLLLSHLVWFRLFPFISLGFCNHCNVASILWSYNFEHPSSNLGVFFFSSPFDRNVDILSNSFSRFINIHLKVRIHLIFQDDTAPYPLPLLISWDWTSSCELSCLLTAGRSLTFATTRYFIQGICPGARILENFRNRLSLTARSCEPHAKPSSCRTTPCRLSAAAYSMLWRVTW